MRLLEFALAIPSDQIWRAGESKSLLRRAMKGRLPEEVRAGGRVGTIAPLVSRGLRDRARPRIEQALADPILGRAGFVRPDVLRREYARLCRGERAEYPLNYAIHLELWLRKCEES